MRKIIAMLALSAFIFGSSFVHAGATDDRGGSHQILIEQTLDK